MSGCQLIVNSPCGFHKEDLMAGASCEWDKNTGLPNQWRYENIVCYQCGTLRSRILKDVYVFVDGVYQVKEHKIGYCRKCYKRLCDIADFDLWEPKHLQIKYSDIGDPWLLCNRPETSDDAELIRYKCPSAISSR